MSRKTLTYRRAGKLDTTTMILVGVAAVATVACVLAFSPWVRGGDVADGATSDRIDSLKKLGAADSDVIANTAVNDPDARVRLVAFRRLDQFVNPAVRDAIEKGMTDQDAKVRAAAAIALGKFADGEAIRKLDGVVSDSGQDERVRLAAVRGLKRCNSRGAEDVLSRTMQRNDSWRVKQKALVILFEGKGITFNPPPDPRKKTSWNAQVQDALNHIKARRHREDHGIRDTLK